MANNAPTRNLLGARTMRSQRPWRKSPRALRALLEALEDRTLLSSNFYQVTGIGDSAGSINGGTGAQGSPFLAATLRAAITAANADGGVDTITFDPNLTLGSPATITLSNIGDTTAGPSDFGIKGNITIQGPTGSKGITLRNGGLQRMFYVSPAGSLTVSNLTIEGGQAKGGDGGASANFIPGAGAAGGAAGLGGAVFDNGGAFTAQACTFTDNSATGGAGGMLPSTSAVQGAPGGGGLGGAGADANGTSGQAGGGPNGGASVATGNGNNGGFGGGGSGGAGDPSVGTGGNGGFGGGGGGGGGGGFSTTGVGDAGGAGGFGGGGGAGGFGDAQLNIGSGQGAPGGPAGFGAGAGNVGESGIAGGGAGLGGAIFSNGGTLTLTNDTFTANSAIGGDGSKGFDNAQGLGGAVFLRNGTLNASFVTFSTNTAAQGGTDLYVLSDASDGGSNTSPGSGTASAKLVDDILGQASNSVTDFVANTNAGGSTPTFTGSGNNLVRSGGGALGGAVISTANPMLAPLGNYGGPTPTFALLPGSPALDVAGVTQDVQVSGSAGTFALTFINQTTGALAFNATAAVVQSQLNSLSTIGGVGGSVTVTPISTGHYLVAFGGTLGSSAQPQLVGTGSGGTTVTVTTVNNSGSPGTDQRGVARPQGSYPDIGAFESRGFRVTAINGSGTQSTAISNAFAKSLAVSVTANDSGLADLTGGIITYTVIPVSGAAATLSSPTATIQSDGTASVTATANATAGSYTVTAAAAPSVGTAGTFNLTNVADTITGSPEPTPLTAVESQAFTNQEVATFTGAGPLSSYSATIDWGDGTPLDTSAVVTMGSAGSFRVLGSHTYAEEGGFNVSVSISGSGGASGSAADTAAVSDAALSGTAATGLSATEAASAAFTLGSVTDAGGDEPAGNYAVTINWGDGTTAAGTLVSTGATTFDVTGTHTYAEEGNFTASYSVRDDGGQSTPAIDVPISVADAQLNSTGQSFTAIAGVSSGAVKLADFTDANPSAPLSDFSATINWGDGTPATTGTIGVDTPGVFKVTAAHTYAMTGTFYPLVTITDEGGQSTPATATANIISGAITANAVPLSAVEGEAFSNKAVADFSNGNPNATSGNFTATITWGDGTSSAGNIVSDGAGGFFVKGTHAFAEEGKHAVGVSIKDKIGHSTAVGQTVSVPDAPLSGTPLTASAKVGQSFDLPIATFLDGDQLNTNGRIYTITVNWGDGNATATGRAVFVSPGHWKVTCTHTFTRKSPSSGFNVVISVKDTGGASPITINSLVKVS